MERACRILEESDISHVLCVTDIENVNASNVVSRPAFVSGDHYPLQSTVKWLLRHIDCTGYKYLVTLMPSCPMITPQDVRDGLKMLKDNKLNIVRSYGKDGDENGLLIADIDYYMSHWMDVYPGALRARGKEIHTEEEFLSAKAVIKKGKYQ